MIPPAEVPVEDYKKAAIGKTRFKKSIRPSLRPRALSPHEFWNLVRKLAREEPPARPVSRD